MNIIYIIKNFWSKNISKLPPKSPNDWSLTENSTEWQKDFVNNVEFREIFNGEKWLIQYKDWSRNYDFYDLVTGKLVLNYEN